LTPNDRLLSANIWLKSIVTETSAS
jgi:hypothetical protein